MPEDNLNFWDYVKAAFHWKTALPLLGKMPLNKFALAGFAILGFGNPGFWLLGLAYEAALLLMLAGNQRFQNLVRGMRMAEIKQTWSQREAGMLAQLDRQSRLRYESLVERCRSVVQADDVPEIGPTIAGLKSEGLNQLLLIFIKLLCLRCRIISTLQKTDRRDLETDINSLNEKIAKEPETSPTRRALQGTLEIQKTRLENLDKSMENLKFTETELDRIEKQVCLLVEEIAVSRNPEQWSGTLDGVVKSMQGTSKWMSDNSTLFETIERPAASVDLMKNAQPQTIKN
ncbi:MAG: hypothetical protein WCK47_04225 [bacterium]|nr:hypothetical protein [Candidatus Sumerlaeota bacterium]